MPVRPRKLVIYEKPDGVVPFEKWLNDLADLKARAIIRKRLNRVRLGNLGDAKSVGNGLFELRIDFGPGYRVYFGEQAETIIVLLCGGDKSSQPKDILNAQIYWYQFLLEERENQR